MVQKLYLHDSSPKTTGFRSQHQGTHTYFKSHTNENSYLHRTRQHSGPKKSKVQTIWQGISNLVEPPERSFESKALYPSFLSSLLGCTCSQDSKLTHCFLYMPSHFSSLLRKLLNPTPILLWMQLHTALL